MRTSGSADHSDAWAKRLQETEMRLERELDELHEKYSKERQLAEDLKNEREELNAELEGQKEDSEAAAWSYEAAIAELKSRLEIMQSDVSQELEESEEERDKRLLRVRFQIGAGISDDNTSHHHRSSHLS